MICGLIHVQHAVQRRLYLAVKASQPHRTFKQELHALSLMWPKLASQLGNHLYLVLRILGVRP